MFFNSNWYPMWINVHCKLGSIEMLGYLKGEYRIIRIIILFQKELEPALITLSDITILSKHWWQLLLLKFLRITLLFLSYFILVHLLIHFFTNLFGIRWLRLVFLFFSHVFLCLSSLLLLEFTLFQLQFAYLYGFIQRFF